jgi:hypothetical protein
MRNLRVEPLPFRSEHCPSLNGRRGHLIPNPHYSCPPPTGRGHLKSVAVAKAQRPRRCEGQTALPPRVGRNVRSFLRDREGFTIFPKLSLASCDSLRTPNRVELKLFMSSCCWPTRRYINIFYTIPVNSLVFIESSRPYSRINPYSDNTRNLVRSFHLNRRFSVIAPS